MIPTNVSLVDNITEIKIPGRTYKISITFPNEDRINGYIEDVEAIKQAIYLILNTERYQYIIYSWNYGVELLDLIGQPISYVMADLPRRIREALTQDDRILDVTDFIFEKHKSKLHTQFKVITEYGEVPTDLEVTV